jgi:hypothetical protein
MAFQITGPADEQLLATYTRARNRVRDTVAFGIYPQVQAALQAYAELDVLVAGLAQGTAKEQTLAAYHAGLMGGIATETAALRASAEALVANIETIEALQPGAFGIQLPPAP